MARIILKAELTKMGIKLWSDAGEIVIKADDNVSMRLKMLVEGETTKQSIENVSTKYGCASDSYYRWRKKYEESGLIGLKDKIRGPKKPSKTDQEVESDVIWYRFYYPELSMYDITREINEDRIKAGKDPLSAGLIGKILKEHGVSKKTFAKKVIHHLRTVYFHKT